MGLECLIPEPGKAPLLFYRNENVRACGYHMAARTLTIYPGLIKQRHADVFAAVLDGNPADFAKGDFNLTVAACAGIESIGRSRPDLITNETRNLLSKIASGQIKPRETALGYADNAAVARLVLENLPGTGASVVSVSAANLKASQNDGRS